MNSNTTMIIATAKLTFDNNSNEVWEALVNPIIVKKYFFGTDMESTWEVGSYVLFKGEYEGKPYVDKGIITDFVPQKLLAYKYRSSWNSTEDTVENYLPVRFELEVIGSKTILTVTQECLSATEADDSTKNWNIVLTQMQEVILNN